MKDHKLVPLRPPESILAVVRKAYGNATAYDVGHVWHEIYTRLPDAAPVQEQQFTADELDLMRQWFESMQDTNRSFVIDADKKLHQKIIAAIQAAPRAEQPRKAVKLSDEEISTIAISNPPNVHIYARAIEQAVLKANGIEP